MLNITFKIKELKRLVKNRCDQDEKFRAVFKETILTIFGDKKILGFIKDFYLKSNKIYILTTNKSFASEVFLNKFSIINSLKKKGGLRVDDLIIK